MRCLSMVNHPQRGSVAPQVSQVVVTLSLMIEDLYLGLGEGFGGHSNPYCTIGGAETVKHLAMSLLRDAEGVRLAERDRVFQLRSWGGSAPVPFWRCYAGG